MLEHGGSTPGLEATKPTGSSPRRSGRSAHSGSFGASKPIAPYHPDVLPADGYSLSARQLMAASVAAFVFGGMGSWNDTGFADREMQARYERVTRQLYIAVMDGLVTAVNASVSS